MEMYLIEDDYDMVSAVGPIHLPRHEAKNIGTKVELINSGDQQTIETLPG